jgi:hypothetical protein
MKKILSALLLSALAARAFAQIEVTSTGDVGVGTATPVTPLNIKGGATMTAGWNKTATLEANYPVQLFFSGSSKWGGIGYDHTTGMRFWVNAGSSDVNGTGAAVLTLLNDTQVRVGGTLGVSGVHGAPAASGASIDHVLRVGSAATNLVLDTGVNGGGGAFTWLQARSQASYADSYPISLNPNGGNVGIGTASPSTGGGFTPKLQLTGAYAALLLDATMPAKKWGLGVDSNGALDIFETTSNTYSNRFSITNAGNVGIGTTSPSQKLQVVGAVRATSFISDTNTYADFVFKPGYQLPALSEVEAHIKEQGHLPGIPSEAEARAEGIDLARMQVQLLQKIEELTLHQIAQEKQLKAQQEEIRELRAQLTSSHSP